MLDDLKLINQRDPSDALGVCQRQLRQVDYEFSFEASNYDVNNIVYSAIGGSTVAGLIAKAWFDLNLPFEIIRGYDIPNYVSRRSLFIACSYSGNTEETLSAIDQAEKQKANIFVIATGGKMIEIAKHRNYPYIILPEAELPRFGVIYHLKALIELFAGLGLINKQQKVSELSSAAKKVTNLSIQWQSTVAEKSNLAKQIANEAAGKSIVIYSGPKLSAAAYKWKIDYNENAKQLAWWNEYPEFNHNEFIGWSQQPPIKPYCVIDLLSGLDNPRVQKRFVITSKILSGRRPEPLSIDAIGDTFIEQIIYLMMLGDFTTIYSAIIAGINPAPVDLVTKLKKELEN